MKRFCALAVLALATASVGLKARLSVQELKALLRSARAAGDSDVYLASQVSGVRMKERVTDDVVPELWAYAPGPKTAHALEILVDESEFVPGIAESGAALSAAERDALLTKAREHAANYIHSLPDFICTRVVRRFDGGQPFNPDSGLPPLIPQLRDTITSEVAFREGRESYAAQTVNGRALETPPPGLTTWGEFGGIVEELLLGGESPKVEWGRWEAMDGKRIAVLRYSVDKRNSHYAVSWCCEGKRTRDFKPAFRGELFVDPETGSIVRMTRSAGFPAGFPILAIDTMIAYSAVAIGGNSYICPLKSVTMSMREAPGGLVLSSVSETRFDRYRKFEVSAKVLAADERPEIAFEAPAVSQATVEPPVEIPQEAAPVAVKTSEPLPEPHGLVLRATTRLVNVSAVVLDRNGRPIRDLKKDDFEIYDETKRQDIRLFSSPAPEPDNSQFAGPPSTRMFSNRVEEGPRPDTLTIILLDLGAARSEESVFARSRLTTFLRQIELGTRIGLYATGSDGIVIIHEPTQDSAALVSSLDAWWGSEPVQFYGANAASWDRDGECPADYALKAITASANHVAGIPARKNLVWFSGGHGAMTEPRNCFRPEEVALRSVNNANVALYSVDLRGLQTIQPDASVSLRDLGYPMTGQQMAAALNTMMQTNLEGIEKDQSIMREVAERTGGGAFSDNDISGALRSATAESGAAYSLGFYPKSPRFDGQYRQIEVRVPARPDATVRYRRGYVDARVSPDPEVQIRDAVQSPLDANAIALTAEIASDEVKVSIGVADLDLKPDDRGGWLGQIHVVLADRDEVGQQLDKLDDTLQLSLKPERYDELRKSGLPYQRTFHANPKAASLRVVVCDDAGTVGSVTIPLAASK